MKRKHSFRTILWVFLFLMMTLMFIIYMSYYVYSESSRISAQTSDSLDQQVLSVRTFTDSELSSLDTVMQNIAYSNLVKEYYELFPESNERTRQRDFKEINSIPSFHLYYDKRLKKHIFYVDEDIF